MILYFVIINIIFNFLIPCLFVCKIILYILNPENEVLSANPLINRIKYVYRFECSSSKHSLLIAEGSDIAHFFIKLNEALYQSLFNVP